jgi:DNA-binding transcriptional ArsR family regulator
MKQWAHMATLRTIDDPRFVKAMSHPLRVRILARLAERTASPNELAEWLDAPLGTVAYHVRTLRRLGLIELRRETRVRGAVQHHYRALPRPLLTDEAWAAAAPIAKQALVGSSLQVIDEQMRASAAAGGFDHADAHVTRTLLDLDPQGWAELSRACARLLEDVEKIESDAAERLAAHPDAHAARHTGLVLLLFEAAQLSGAQTSARRRGRAPARRRPAALEH